MNIEQTPSPNHDDRTLPVTLLVLHYTGMESGEAALLRMCDSTAKVSAHYMVWEDGRICQLVDESRRAWHAGVSNWAGESNINSASIGIEIVNGGHDFGLPDFPSKQILAVTKLCNAITNRHNIDPMNIVAHSDIAPQRKQDPGEKFPWQMIARNGVGYWPKLPTQTDNRILFERGARDKEIAIIQSGLAYLGYGMEVTGVFDDNMRLVLTAFQRRYRPSEVDGKIDVQSLELLTDLTNFRKSGNTTEVS